MVQLKLDKVSFKEQMQASRLWQLLAMILVGLLICLSLGEAYRFLQNLFDWQTWQAAMVVHALLLIGFNLQRRSWRFWRQDLSRLGGKWSWRVIAFLLGLWTCLGLARFFGTPVPFGAWPDWKLLLTVVLLVPVLEEFLFRGFIGAQLKSYFGPMQGSYLSIFVFTYTHALPTWSSLPWLPLGVSLGVLLLGLSCEYLLVKSDSLLPSILLHAGMNATALLLGWYDSRWLDWLSPLFLAL